MAEANKTDPLFIIRTPTGSMPSSKGIRLPTTIFLPAAEMKINFFTSVDYHDDGLVPNTGFRRLNFCEQPSYKVNKMAQAGK